ncbi:MAG: class I SAM-dependent methyltransferase, partial [bacterium]
GEGYVTRQLKARGASHIEGIDISEQMIEIARSYEEKDSLVINYSTGSATDLSYLGGTTFDLVIAVFLFNYLTVEEMSSVMQQVFRLLKPNGRFIFSIPHPSLPFTRPALPPFYFLPENYGYFSGIDRTFEGRIWRRDGTD